MRWFYVTALAVVTGLTVSPMLLLPGRPRPEPAGKVVGFDLYRSPVKSMDPATCSDTVSANFQGFLYEGLYHYHYLRRPARASVEPQLAAAMPQVSKDALTYRIRLREGVRYHRNPCFGRGADGRAKTRSVRADDFVLAFKRVADYYVNTGLAWAFATRVRGLREYRKKTEAYKIGDFSRYDLPVEGLRAPDDLTLEIELSEPYPQFLYVLAMKVYAPIPREAVDYWLATEDDGDGGRRPLDVQRCTTEFRQVEQVVGTGAYRLKAWVRKARLVFERNPDFREDFYPTDGEPGDREAGLLDDAGRRVPFIDAFHFSFVAERHSSWMLFLTRQCDTSAISEQVFETLVSPTRELADRWRGRGIRLNNFWPPTVYWIVFNMEDDVLGASKALRQALCLSFSVEDYLRVLFNGRGKRAVNVLPSSFKAWKQAGPGPYFRHDLDLARKRIARAKVELAAKGLLVRGEIPPLVLDLGGTDGETARRGEFFRRQFAKVGVRLKFVLNDWPRLQEKVNNKQCQMVALGSHAHYGDAEDFLQLYYSPNIAKQTNSANYANGAFDRLYERARVMGDSPQRTRLYARMVRLLSEDCPVLMLTEPESYWLSHEWVRNGKPHPLGTGYAKYLRIDTDLRRRLGGKER